MMVGNGTKSIPAPLLVLVVAILFTQGMWLFNDAGKRNAKKWFWGLWGLIQFPCPLLFYLIFVRKVFKRKSKKD